MPECHVCGGNTFFEEDGQFFCTVCNTQSQSMVVMETEEDVHSQMRVGVLREIGRTKKGLKKIQDIKDVAGRPWTKYEAYQLILQAQAKALIDHGAHPFIREAILRLWHKYLSVLGVAFTEGKTNLVPRELMRVKGLWYRELHCGGLESPEIKVTAVKRTMKKNGTLPTRSRVKRQKLEAKQEKESFSQTLEGETFYEGDNPFAESDSEESTEDSDSGVSAISCNSHSVDSFEESDHKNADKDVGELSDPENFGQSAISSTPKQKDKYKKNKKAPDANTIRRKAVQHMNLPKTLAFCYLGCLFAGKQNAKQITVADILQWVCDGTLPYLETTHLLREDMKLSAYDRHLFWPAPVTSAKVFLMAGSILKYIGADDLPVLPVKQILQKFIRALELPEEMETHAAALLTKYPPDMSRPPIYAVKAIPDVDATCAAYAFVLVKLFYGLNDQKERQLVEYSRELQARVGPGVNLLDFNAWQYHIHKKFSPGVQSFHMWGKFTLKDVESFCNTFKNAGFMEQRHSLGQMYTRKRKKTMVATYDLEKRELLRRPIHTLLERLKNRAANDERNRKQNSEERSMSSSQEEARAQTADFRTATVEHVFDPTKFLRRHVQSFNTDDSVSVRSTLPSISRTVLDSCSNSTMQEYCAFCDMTNKAGENTAGTSSPLRQEGTAPNHAASSCTKPQCKVAAMFYAWRKQIGDPYLQYQRLKPWHLSYERDLLEVRKQQHLSYKWLLKVLSSMSYCDETSIERKLWDLEDKMKAHFHSRIHNNKQ